MFILIMDLLSKMIKKALLGGRLLGFMVEGRSGGVLNMSHFLFIDDTIIFCGGDMECVRVLRRMLLCFEPIMGLQVNLRKSEIVLVGVVQRVEELAMDLCCKVSSLPMNYLGLPLGSSFKA